MKLPFFLNPAHTFRALAEIDAEPPSFTQPPREGARTALWILFASCWLLLILNYGKSWVALEGLLHMAAPLVGEGLGAYAQSLRSGPYGQLWQLAWWSLLHFICFVVVPVAIIKWYLRRPVAEFGAGWGETHLHWQGYVALLLPILAAIVVVSHRDDFVNHYPFYQFAGRSWTEFLLWEFIYLAQFASLEFFFRGFMVSSLRPAFGSGAIFIMMVPYLMIHFPKPWLEATGSIFFGLFLAILALRSRSIWGGFGVHAGVAIGMDIAALVQKGQFPPGG